MTGRAPAARIAEPVRKVAIQPCGRRPSALEVLTLRAWARATLWQANELPLHDAVDALQASAVASGLVDQLGQDRAQEIVAKAFEVVQQ
jgi:hypothetical protein